MFKKIFLDANIIADIFDALRQGHLFGKMAFLYILEQGIDLYTSCDIITTVYYVYAKRDRKNALEKIRDLNQTLKVIEFSNPEIDETCELMKHNRRYADLEDSLQYVLAMKAGCDLILSNDSAFVSTDIPVMTTAEFCGRFDIG
jgi:predicted nucleic acid-binding protein